MSRYTGWVRATQTCHAGGHRRNRGDVFYLEDVTLWSDDPYTAVDVTHSTDEPQHGTTATKTVVHTVPIPAPVRDASQRGLGESTGLRPDA